MDERICLLLFAKYPDPGRVKTRLARHVGPENAAALARCFLIDELQTLLKMELPILLFHDPPESGPAFGMLTEGRCSSYPQQGIDLGERMAHAFEKAFSLGHPAALLVGSDLPDLPLTHLEEAVAALIDGKAVLGPALDGGYYLIGFPREQFLPQLFEEMRWSSPEVFSHTLEKFAEHGKEVHLLPPWQDMDTVADLENFRSRAGDIDSLTLDFLRELSLVR
jgi:uncharacterized protein